MMKLFLRNKNTLFLDNKNLFNELEKISIVNVEIFFVVGRFVMLKKKQANPLILEPRAKIEVVLFLLPTRAVTTESKAKLIRTKGKLN